MITVIRSPLVSLPVAAADVASFPVETETSSWLASLPKPIPTTAPLFVAEKKEKDDEKYTSQSPTCSSVSFKSDLSAFHQLSSDRTLLSSPVDTASPSSSSSSASSRISPRGDCFDCHVTKSKLTVSENKCKYLEGKVSTLQQEALEAHAQMNAMTPFFIVEIDKGDLRD
uniref:Uncharacterized protein n=1 Tax=Caenorhabditis japonica TaxID=281687 RepID=A0A8R1DE79_CAEJA